MRVCWYHALPAVLAALLICAGPGCASVRPAPAPEVAHVPTSPWDISGIKRGAGEFDPPNLHGSGEAWGYLLLLAVYAVVYIGYGIGWCFVSLAELISEAIEDSGYDDCGDEP